MQSALHRSSCLAGSSGRRMLAPRCSSAAIQAPTAQQPRTSTSADDWAIIRVNGVRQFLEVGRRMAVGAHEVTAAPGNRVRFQEVVAAKTCKQGLVKKQLLNSVVVEGLVEDEFQGPASRGSQETKLKKVVITSISLDQ